MRVLLPILSFLPVVINGVLWLRYYLPLTTHQYYHTQSFVITLGSALLVTLLLFGIRAKKTWLRVTSFLLLLPAVPFWLFMAFLALNSFRIH